MLMILPAPPQDADKRPDSSARRSTRSPHGALAVSCENCHSYTSWKPIRQIPEFNHDKTGYPLRGMHASVTCAQCHSKLVFTDVGKKCADCHADIHKRQFGAKCESCHTVKGWQVSVQSIRQHQNRFPLLGAHAVADCASCHKGSATGQYQGLSTQCSSCHMEQYRATKSPNHLTLNFPTDCSTCHSFDGWSGAKFDHLKITGFALSGAHANLDCASCHVGGNYQGASAACYSCHSRDYNATRNPHHVTGNFPRECSQCHSTVSWAGATFDHNTRTRFPLTGAHTSTQCMQCHVNGRFAGTPMDCASCHLPAYQQTSNPNHATAGFPTTCQTCHTTVQWAGARFDHANTGFTLTGVHVNTSCTQCHANNRYAGTPTDCYSCHIAAYQRTTNPNHITAMFPTTCQTCHTTVQWAGARFDHNTYTNFPLTGAHASVACAQCHVNNRYAGTPTTCSSCHLQQYQATTSPNHARAGFPTDCSICHTTTQWPGARFDHASTQFPLTGAHVNATCQSCHSSGVYNGLSTACSSCHLNDYNNSTNPNHRTAGFPTNCQLCHSTAVWRPSTFNHSLTRFPLAGAHTSTPCASCHVGGRYSGTPTDCYSCHRTDFTGTTNPNHVAAAFPTTCQTCHTTVTWSGARFNHTWFPIYSGAHAGKWQTCADCHNNPSNYTVFTCISCHQHNKTSMDDKHSGVRNYVYNSANCYSCHPTGQH